MHTFMYSTAVFVHRKQLISYFSLETLSVLWDSQEIWPKSVLWD